MTIQSVDIEIDRQRKSIVPGLKTGHELHAVAGDISSDEQLLLEIEGDIDVPVGLHDQIVITGHERFSIGKKQHGIEDNPRLRHPVLFSLNETEVDQEHALKHAKVMPVEILHLDNSAAPGSRLFADLDGLADEEINLEHRIVVKPHDKFIVMPPREDDCPRDVTVKIDNREVTLPVGRYTGAQLKVLFEVRGEYELDIWDGGEFKPIADDQYFEICKPETFVSHSRTGSSS